MVINITMIAGMMAFGILVASVTTSLARADVAATRCGDMRGSAAAGGARIL